MEGKRRRGNIEEEMMEKGEAAQYIYNESGARRQRVAGSSFALTVGHFPVQCSIWPAGAAWQAAKQRG